KSKWNSTWVMVSPLFAEGPDLPLERPGVARFSVNLPISLGDRGWPHQPTGVEVGERGLALALLDAAAHPFGIDASVDHQMGDVDVARTELARRALGHRAQSEFGAWEGGIADPAAPAGGGSGKED